MIGNIHPGRFDSKVDVESHGVAQMGVLFKRKREGKRADEDLC